MGYSMSMFNTQEICLECKQDERMAPGYERASATEHSEVQLGLEKMRAGEDYRPHYNFEGVGLSEEDRKFLTERLRQRGIQDVTL